jgi:CRISPR-associated protein Csd1
MSILASLVRAYERMTDAPAPGYSVEKIGWVIPLREDGSPAGSPIDLRSGEGKKKAPRQLQVPASYKRPGTTPRSFFLWDNTAFVLGVTAMEGKDAASRHEAFKVFHRDALADETDPGLVAVLRFLVTWMPDRFTELGWPEEMKDQNVVFALDDERRERFIHDRMAARAAWSRLTAEGAGAEAVCLVTGKTAPVARLHPGIKGVWGGQSSGGSIVSFNKAAFESYGHEQGDNSPVSEYAAFAYTTVLNRFLDRDSGHRIQIGDASTVFWAEAADGETAAAAESAFAWMIDPATADEGRIETGKVGEVLRRLRDGLPADRAVADLAGVRFHVLGLAPNAARISIRFHVENDFGTIAANHARFVEELRIEPPPREAPAPLWRYLVETAVLRKRENVPPNLSGDWLRAILAGTPHPLTLLSTVLMRIRAAGDVNALRVGMLKAVLVRNFEREAPVALDPACTDRGYLLGRLFATYEHVQRAALGAKVNATVKDKYYGAASAQPQKVFGLLAAGAANHLSKVGRASPGRRVNLEKRLGTIMDLMDPSGQPFPPHLSAEEQAMFALGYHHQLGDFFRKKDMPEPATAADPADAA